MCLYNAKRKLFRKERTCYKIVYAKHHLCDRNFRDDEELTYITKFQAYDIKFGIEDVAETEVNEFKTGHKYIDVGGHTIEVCYTPKSYGSKPNKEIMSIYGGMFHSFKRLENAIDDVGDDYDGRLISYIVKCTIPKDSVVYSGFFNGCEAYASSKIIYDEVVYCSDDDKPKNFFQKLWKKIRTIF